MRNPFARLAKRDTARPSLRERAASLKSSAARVIRRKAVTTPAADLPVPPLADTGSPDLAAMIAEWAVLAEKQEDVSLSDEESGAIGERWSSLQAKICQFPARTLADLRAKAPVYECEWNEERSPMPRRAWESVLRDMKSLSTTPSLAFGSVDDEGFVTYEDAAGHAHRRPVAQGIAFMAARLSSIAKSELTRQFNARCESLSEEGRVALEDDLRRELRVDALHDFAFRSDRIFEVCKDYAVGHRWASVGKNADAELLALGREFDALHTEWVPAALAQEGAEAKAHVLHKDLSERRGWTVREAYEAAWDEPGLREAVDRGEAEAGRIGLLQDSIRALPARTLDGLAVKARAAIPAFWSRGGYQRDANLGKGEDWIELNARSLIDECLHLAGVDWTGRRFRPSSPLAAEEAVIPAAAQPVLTPKASAEGIALSELNINELCALYEKAGAIMEMWGGFMCQPIAIAKEHPDGTVTHSPLGQIATDEDGRMGFLRDRVVKEAAGRTPADKWERDNLLSLRIQHEIACEGSIVDAVLLADITRVWG